MLQDIFLFELNFKNKRRLNVVCMYFLGQRLPETNWREADKSQNNPKGCPVMGITQRN